MRQVERTLRTLPGMSHVVCVSTNTHEQYLSVLLVDCMTTQRDFKAPSPAGTAGDRAV